MYSCILSIYNLYLQGSGTMYFDHYKVLQIRLYTLEYMTLSTDYLLLECWILSNDTILPNLADKQSSYQIKFTNTILDPLKHKTYAMAMPKDALGILSDSMFWIISNTTSDVDSYTTWTLDYNCHYMTQSTSWNIKSQTVLLCHSFLAVQTIGVGGPCSKAFFCSRSTSLKCHGAFVYNFPICA